LVAATGTYQIIYSLSLDNSGISKEYHVRVSVDNVEILRSASAYTTKSATSTWVMSGTCIADITAGQTVRIQIEGVTDNTTVNCRTGNVNVVRLH
jgi:hypothetical protein